MTPKDLTEGACEAGAGPTSKEILENRCLSLGRRCARIGSSWMSLSVKVLKSSALVFEADTTSMFFLGSRSSWCTTYAEQIQLLPTPLKPSIIALRQIQSCHRVMSQNPIFDSTHSRIGSNMF